MDSIEKRALEKYPVYISETSDQCIEYDSNESDRITYTEGARDQKKLDDAKYSRLRELARNMYTAAMYLSTDASSLRKATDEFYHFINYEEKEMN